MGFAWLGWSVCRDRTWDRFGGLVRGMKEEGTYLRAQMGVLCSEPGQFQFYFLLVGHGCSGQVVNGLRDGEMLSLWVKWNGMEWMMQRMVQILRVMERVRKSQEYLQKDNDEGQRKRWTVMIPSPFIPRQPSNLPTNQSTPRGLFRLPLPVSQPVPTINQARAGNLNTGQSSNSHVT